MNYLFVHQNFPGQFRHVAPVLAKNPANTVVCVGDAESIKDRPLLHPRIKMIAYPPLAAANPTTHHYIRDYERAIRRGQAVVRVAMELKQQGFNPDVVVVHPAWGEGLFLKDIFPGARHIHYFEFYYLAEGSDVGFDPEYPDSLDDRLRVRVKNSTQLLSLEVADAGISPTQWQKSQYPSVWSNKIRVLHDGIDTDVVKPGADARLALNKLTLTHRDEVITYVSRNLEPYRGFHRFMRALPRILDARPQAHVVIVGGDGVSYGKRPADGKSYRELLLQELGDKLDDTRVHFLGRVPYATYLKVLQISTAHVYLTYPFVLSWSMLEAMSAGCALVASDTPPVREVVRHGENGLLVDFFDQDALVSRVIELLSRREDFTAMRLLARDTIRQSYDLKSRCMPDMLSWLSTGR